MTTTVNAATPLQPKPKAPILVVRKSDLSTWMLMRCMYAVVVMCALVRWLREDDQVAEMLPICGGSHSTDMDTIVQ